MHSRMVTSRSSPNASPSWCARLLSSPRLLDAACRRSNRCRKHPRRKCEASMQEPDFAGLELSTARVVVWGLGLMGGSLALALRSKCARLVVIDNDPAVVALATERGVVDAAFVDPRAGLDGADLIILALPVRVILTALAELAELCSTPAVIIDLGPTKTQIVVAMQNLPKRFEPLGGHPMCGKEKSSLANADALLYQHAPFGLVALDRTGAAARRLAEEL